MEHPTRDIAFASYLLMRDFPFVRVETKGHVKYWVFNISEDPSSLEADWINSEARRFFQSFSELKNTLGERGTHGKKMP